MKKHAALVLALSSLLAAQTTHRINGADLAKTIAKANAGDACEGFSSAGRPRRLIAA